MQRIFSTIFIVITCLLVLAKGITTFDDEVRHGKLTEISSQGESSAKADDDSCMADSFIDATDCPRVGIDRIELRTTASVATLHDYAPFLRAEARAPPATA